MIMSPLRYETPGDYAAIDRINIEAFANHPFSHQTEHLIVNALRIANALTVSLVAEAQGQVVGHVAFSPVLIDDEDVAWFALGPLSVLPSHQRQGMGSRLVVRGLDELRKRGANGCVLVGEPGYYERFGFRYCATLALRNIPSEYVLCLPLSGSVPRGIVTHHQAFYVSA